MRPVTQLPTLAPEGIRTAHRTVTDPNRQFHHVLLAAYNTRDADQAVEVAVRHLSDTVAVARERLLAMSDS